MIKMNSRDGFKFNVLRQVYVRGWDGQGKGLDLLHLNLRSVKVHFSIQKESLAFITFSEGFGVKSTFANHCNTIKIHYFLNYLLKRHTHFLTHHFLVIKI